jgi:CBS domain-containing protein
LPVLDDAGVPVGVVSEKDVGAYMQQYGDDTSRLAMPVSAVMSSPAISIRSTARIAYAAGLMLQQCVPPLHHNRHALTPRRVQSPYTNAMHLACILPCSRVHRLPVVDESGRCVAMLTRTDVFRPLIPDALADPLYLQKARPAPAWEGGDVGPWDGGRDLPSL